MPQICPGDVEKGTQEGKNEKDKVAVPFPKVN